MTAMPAKDTTKDFHLTIAGVTVQPLKVTERCRVETEFSCIEREIDC